MTPTLDTHSLIGAFVDELARCGVTDACTSPGSRCAPLVLALARDPALRAHSHVDERCSGFFALGLAKASGRPVVLTCTSGTAAANLAPAVIEADMARIPLIVLTADRPPELREVGAGQAIDQIKLYGTAVRWFFEVGTHGAGPPSLRWIRALGCRAVAEACGERPGPVHLNWSLREPLVPDGRVTVPGGRPGRRPWVERQPVAPLAGELSELIDGSRRGVIVAGRSERPLRSLPALASACNYPLLADPLSGARSGSAAIAHYDLLLRDEQFVASHRPEVVLRVGDLPTSKTLRGWLGGLEIEQIAVDPQGAWQDPAAVLWRSLRSSPELLRPPLSADAAWLEQWRDADLRTGELVLRTLSGEVLSELGVSRMLGERLPDDAVLFVAASMPVRQIEMVWPARAAPPRVLANRGANGIDGTVSSAFGACAADVGPVVALVGDVALAHDVGGLLAARRLGLGLTIMLLDNGGGAIFDHLPIAAASDVFETHVATPTGIDFAAVAEAYGLHYSTASSLTECEALLARALADPLRSSLLHLRSERAASLALHQRLLATLTRSG